MEITIEPDRISILSFSGPNHTISIEAIHEGRLLRSRRYRNRRLGEFLKELDLTEGRCTGIPTIQDELAKNGSPAATIETDDARSYFIIDIPCHPDFKGKEIVMDDENVAKGVVKDVVNQLTDRQRFIIDLIQSDVTITASEMSQRLNAASRTIQRDIAVLQKLGLLVREGSRSNGRWIVKKII